ncbi:YlbL family protein [Zhihengliuella salsuginis]|uniref:endopeptidase La n=1 Tax=Zhihengliuella salsuginis TaxID=578222 RepID=A0ABQ3GEJ6_9MICC|nr:S16 family serine protease [Zhihengliuella salsuginis]GHD03637.1 hypothetical protein GCM10008096_09880 [Zhihengliuella salsuginis]
MTQLSPPPHGLPSTPDDRPVRPHRLRRTLLASTAVVVGLSFVTMALPAPYVIESPGPTINTVGEVEGEPALSVEGAESYRPEGRLDLTTVYVRGGGGRQVTFFEALQAWADPTADVFPEESVYPRGVTGDQISEQNTAQMDESQETSVAAALGQLDIDYDASISVVDFASAQNEDVLEVGDVVTELDGGPVRTVQELRDGLQERVEDGHVVTVQRGSETLEVPVETTSSPDGTQQIGIFLRTDFEFPFDVGFALEDIGGPSAGMMFSLGIIDLLTEGDLTGGEHIAGTGTVTAGGAVGPIGGIAQKVVGAREAGASVFLAPAGNCPDLEGRVPDGMRIVQVETLQDAYDAVRRVGAGESLDGLPGCG